VTLVKVGDRVAYADAFGAYTTVRLYPEDRLTLIPDGVTDDQAASSLLKGLTARYLLKEPFNSTKEIPSCTTLQLVGWVRSSRSGQDRLGFT